MQTDRHVTKIAGLLLFVTSLLGAAPASFAAQDGNMLYLVEFEATEAGSPTSRESAITLLEDLVIPSLEQLANEGGIRAGGLLVGARAGVFIVEAASNAAVTQLVRALPAWGVWGWKVTPLENFAFRIDLEKKVIQSLRAQK